MKKGISDEMKGVQNELDGEIKLFKETLNQFEARVRNMENRNDDIHNGTYNNSSFNNCANRTVNASRITLPIVTFSGLSHSDRISFPPSKDSITFGSEKRIVKIENIEITPESFHPENISKYIADLFGRPTILKPYIGVKRDHRTPHAFCDEFLRYVRPYCGNDFTAVLTFYVNLQFDNASLFCKHVGLYKPLSEVFTEFIREDETTEILMRDVLYDVMSFHKDPIPSYKGQNPAGYAEFWLERLQYNHLVASEKLSRMIAKRMPEEYKAELRELPLGCSVVEVIYRLREDEREQNGDDMADLFYSDLFQGGNKDFRGIKTDSARNTSHMSFSNNPSRKKSWYDSKAKNTVKNMYCQ